MAGSVAGGLMAAAVTSLRQDYLGKEAYIESVQEHWISAQISVPLALVLLLVSVAITISAGSQLARLDKNDES